MSKLAQTCPNRCGWVFMGMSRCKQMCTGVCKCAWVCAGMQGCAWVCTSVYGCEQVCMGVQVCTDVCKCAQMCGSVHGYMWMNRIPNGAHLTRATSAFAPPPFLPHPEIIYIHLFLCPTPNHMYMLALLRFSPDGRQCKYQIMIRVYTHWTLICILYEFLLTDY